MKQFMGTHKVGKGETLLSIAKQYYGSEVAGKYISQANGGVANAHPGMVLKLPNVTAVGEQGVEMAFDVGNHQMIAPNQEAQAMLQGGFRPAQGRLMGGAMPGDYIHPVTGQTIRPQTNQDYTLSNLVAQNNPAAGTPGDPNIVRPPNFPNTPLNQPGAYDTLRQQTQQAADQSAKALQKKIDMQNAWIGVNYAGYTVKELAKAALHPGSLFTGGFQPELTQNQYADLKFGTVPNPALPNDPNFPTPQLTYNTGNQALPNNPSYTPTLSDKQVLQRKYDTLFAPVQSENVWQTYGYKPLGTYPEMDKWVASQFTDFYTNRLDDWNKGVGPEIGRLPGAVVANPDFPISIDTLMAAGFQPSADGNWWEYNINNDTGGNDGGGGGGGTGGNRFRGYGYGGGNNGGFRTSRSLGFLANWRGVGFG